jgi:endonuclease/exonuclease/phosphatase family metal-dependent hydrolase
LRLAAAGIDGLFCGALLSHPLGTRKPQSLMYQLLLDAARCPADQVLFCGDNLHNDVAAPLAHGMRAALVRPGGLRPGGSAAGRRADDLPRRRPASPSYGEDMTLTFATWNLLEGGLDAAGIDTRLRRQLAVLAALQPTVVALQECKYWDRNYFRIFHRAEQLLGLRGYLSPSAHHGCHLAVFIREGAGLQVMEQRHEHGHPYWHGAARIVVAADGYLQPLHLVSTHLAPSSPSIRLAGAEAFGLLAGDGPVIAGGDYRSAAIALEEAGFLDVGAHAGDPTPTVGHFGPDKLAYRCDRLYTTLPAETITGYRVLTEVDAESDHRPVIAAFDLTKAADYACLPASDDRTGRSGVGLTGIRHRMRLVGRRPGGVRCCVMAAGTGSGRWRSSRSGSGVLLCPCPPRRVMAGR